MQRAMASYSVKLATSIISNARPVHVLNSNLNVLVLPFPPGLDVNYIGLSLASEENELLRKALRQAKPILCTRLPIDFLPTVLQSKSVISCVEYQHIRGERNSVDQSLKLLEQMERKSIPDIRRFLEILKSDENFHGYRYLADMVESDCARLMKKKEATNDGKQSSIIIIASTMIITPMASAIAIVAEGD